MEPEVWTIVVAAGSGSRFGRAKQFESIAGRRVVDRAVDAARGVSTGIVVVVPPGGDPAVDAIVGVDAVVDGGVTRSASVRNGLAVVPSTADVVVVHDAARPVASGALFTRVIDAVLAGADAAVPGVALADSLRSRAGGVVDRDGVVAVQTPQAFAAAALRMAHAGGTDATDDATVVERAGGSVVLVEGEPTNMKITEPIDLAVVGLFLGGGVARLRVGNGFDIHRFSDDPGRVLVLGGVRFDGAAGLVGHSDADVLTHACAEALLGAAGLGDLGEHFPDTDDRWSDADSMSLLAAAVEMLAGAGWRAVNLDASVIAERPKLAPRRAEMEGNLSAVVGAPVSVKGRRAEGIGGIGRSEGIVAMVTALIEGTERP